MQSLAKPWLRLSKGYQRYERLHIKIKKLFALSTVILLRLPGYAYRLGVSGANETTPLLVVLLRVLFSTGRLLRASSVCLPRRRRQSGAKVSPKTIIGPNVITADKRQPRSDRSSVKFRRVWTPPQTGAFFERKRLMRMIHRRSKKSPMLLAGK
jgi:hypothetical protein